MSERPNEKLVWPPTAEDLRRLYIDERLSAAEIAARYGLEYASPKTAESTILHHLKRNGISRRDKAEHIRKVTEEMVDGWVRRYEAGESLKQIAANEFSPVTVFLHLRKRGLQLRDKVEAQIVAVTKFERTPFGGDRHERAYVLGFVWGDCSVEKHGRATRVRSGTTHPDFASLFKCLFDRHGHVRMYPKPTSVTPAEWNLEVDLDGSFEFLHEKNIHAVPEGLATDSTMDFIAGFADAEGSVYFHRARRNFVFQISNTNEAIMRAIQRLLEAEGYSARMSKSYSGAIGPNGATSDLYHLGLYKPTEVGRILKALPLRHKEKTAKARIAIDFIESNIILAYDEVPEGWSEYLAEVALEVNLFVQEALRQIKGHSGSESLLS